MIIVGNNDDLKLFLGLLIIEPCSGFFKIKKHTERHDFNARNAIADASTLTLPANLPPAMVNSQLNNIQHNEAAAIIGCRPTDLLAMGIVLGEFSKQVVCIDHLILA